ncbi:MAG: tetratricopeptide repeat protein [Deltaproteobacteria bacterium]|nr:tetratricopeptide repeat protein [Deltaproteobacteria bacterium]
MAEEAELSLEQKKEILYLHANLATLSYWDLLGIPWNASCEEAQEAFRRQALSLHPDRLRGKRLGRFGARLQAIFPKLNEARETLADPGRRSAYARKTASPTERAKLEVRDIQEERRAEERRARLARQNPIVAKVARVGELMTRARRALEEGRWSQAANDFQLVCSLDPKNEEARKQADEARRKAAASRAAELHEKGLATELGGSLQAALTLFREAVEVDPGSSHAATAASRVARTLGDLPTARDMAERAVRAGPRDAAAHEALAQALAAQGDSKEARRVAERALELDPRLEGAKAVLKKRWGLFG